jgi:hypothetical protein
VAAWAKNGRGLKARAAISTEKGRNQKHTVNLVPYELGDEDCMCCANNLWQIEDSSILDLSDTTSDDLPH